MCIILHLRRLTKRDVAVEETDLPQDLTILVGTQTGIAQLVAQAIELRLEGEANVRVRMMDALDASVFAAGGLFLICTSTYGQGDVPDNARQLYESLCTERPDLSNVRYGVIALGDRTYAQTFCFGAKRFDKLLTELGAQRVGEIMLNDASDGTLPEDEAVVWIEGWMTLCRQLPEAAQAKLDTV
ncbi:MAG TPA: flavodoxin domain-containing protein [Burkholderiales bacterium]|jgi:MioC protein|nr:flavodoxin domain-containing protein [Burkholderiales bacterium]